MVQKIKSLFIIPEKILQLGFTGKLQITINSLKEITLSIVKSKKEKKESTYVSKDFQGPIILYIVVLQ